MKVAFNRRLYEFLIQKGYSHLYAIGNRVAEGGPDNEDYILVPLWPDDPRIHFEEIDAIIEPIASNEVKDMLQGDPFINFYIELEPAIYKEFKAL